ncbi:hypothetical protein [Sphingopyxis sp. GW247-27LB]|uniref:hypothetical protein n=1 Tax=Sphingopyxis sp. GW247-27LB TaxID=2012632 RepID=UPI000BA69CB3|nr:hypothetical protein [Sphingopyxis sp. GW247-27LB]PAL22433.1 hypothetical protein CD928_10045 [Sphingopyxis sp. GW247-27LB]
MTKTKFGRTGKAARLPLIALALALAAGGIAPARAQQTETPAPAPTPAPGGLSDFRLRPADDGRQSGVQGPADNGLAPLAPGERRGVPTPAPQPAAPRIVPTQPTRATPTPAPAPSRREPAAPAPTRATPDSAPVAAAPTTMGTAPTGAVSAPSSSADLSPPVAGSSPAPSTVDDVAAVPATGSDGGTPVWAWLLAVLAAAAAGVWYWRRRPQLAGGVSDEPIEPHTPSPPVPRAATPPVRPAAPPPRPAEAPRPVETPAAPPPLVTRAAAEQRAEVAMTLDVRAIRMTPENLVVGFVLDLANRGSVAATGLMVRIALNQGSAMQEGVVMRFFDGAGGSVLRDDISLAPGASEALTTEVMLPRASVEPLMIGGKPMLVPVLVFDVTYHWEGDADAFGQVAGTFVLGRGPAPGTGDKLAPLPLDRPSYAVDRPAARATAMRRAL